MLLAWLRHGSNALLVVAALALAVLFSVGALSFTWWAVPIGIAFFFVNEYTTHRFGFHAKPSTIAPMLWFQRRMHYDHHREPDRIDLLFLPWWFVAPVTALFFGLFFAITHSVALSCSLFLGALIGVAYYEWVHYIAHIPYRPRSPWARYMKKYHLWHHFKSEHHWYGVTSPVMDFPGMSYAKVAAVEKSGSTRELFS